MGLPTLFWKCVKVCKEGERMKRLIGYSLFCIGVGMVLMWIISSAIIGFLLICLCMVLGYFLFCC